MYKKHRIGIITPSYNINFIDPKWVSIGVSKLETLGFDVKFGNNVRCKEEFSNIAGSVEERIDDINQFLLDDTVDILMAAIGGYGASQLLKQLDYELIKKTNKKFIGFSDTSVLLNSIYKKTGICTYLGPSFISFCNPNIPESVINSFMDVVVNEKEEVIYIPPDYFSYDDWYLKDENSSRELIKHKGHIFIQEGRVAGTLIGGNCQSIVRLAGTDYFPNTDESILFLEDVPNESPDVFVSELIQLRDMGVFDKIRGLIIGQFGYDNEFYNSKKFISTVKDMCGKSNIPILINATFSHVDPIFTIKIGGNVLLDSSNNTLMLNNTFERT